MFDPVVKIVSLEDFLLLIGLCPRELSWKLPVCASEFSLSHLKLLGNSSILFSTEFPISIRLGTVSKTCSQAWSASSGRNPSMWDLISKMGPESLFAEDAARALSAFNDFSSFEKMESILFLIDEENLLWMELSGLDLDRNLLVSFVDGWKVQSSPAREFVSLSNFVLWSCSRMVGNFSRGFPVTSKLCDLLWVFFEFFNLPDNFLDTPKFLFLLPTIAKLISKLLYSFSDTVNKFFLTSSSQSLFSREFTIWCCLNKVSWCFIKFFMSWQGCLDRMFCIVFQHGCSWFGRKFTGL